tara:strand:- start:871 stop:1140 length:270 start_codon:yes stop_codon:yes gene_type:complete
MDGQKKDVIFANGFYAKNRSPKTPDWVIAKFGIKVDELDWFSAQVKEAKAAGKEFINFDIRQGKTGTNYIALDTFEPQKKGEFKDDIPF